MTADVKATVDTLLKGIERYNPNNLPMFESYVERQCKENTYCLEVNLAVLKLYQFNPSLYQASIARKILLKALTNLPHTDLVLCKCLLSQDNWDSDVQLILCMAAHLELCEFDRFWKSMDDHPPIAADITGFDDSIRRFVCHVVNITYQRIKASTLRCYLNVDEKCVESWIAKYGWQRESSDSDMVFISNQEISVKPKSIREKIDFDSVASLMTLTR